MATIAIQTKDYKVVFPLSFKDDLDKIGVWEDFVEETLHIDALYISGRSANFAERKFNDKPLDSWVILTTVLVKSTTIKGFDFWADAVYKLQDLAGY